MNVNVTLDYMEWLCVSTGVAKQCLFQTLKYSDTKKDSISNVRIKGDGANMLEPDLDLNSPLHFL